MKNSDFQKHYNILFHEHNADKRTQNVFLNNFNSIDEFLNFDPANYRKLANCGAQTERLLQKIRVALLHSSEESILDIDNQNASQILALFDFHLFISQQDILRRTKNIITANYVDAESFINANKNEFIRLPNCGKNL